MVRAGSSGIGNVYSKVNVEFSDCAGMNNLSQVESIDIGSYTVEDK